MNKAIFCMITIMLVQSCDRAGSFSAEDVFRDTPAIKLAKSIAHNDADGIRRQKQTVNIVGRYGLTPLLWAVKRDGVSPRTASEIIAIGGDPFFYSRVQRSSPIEHVINYGSAEYFDIFIQKIRDIDRYTGVRLEPTALFIAIVNRDDTKVADLLSRGASVDERNADGDTPLLFAKANQFDIALTLIKFGADVHAVDKHGRGICGLFKTPVNNLSAYSRSSRTELLRELSRSGIECRSSLLDDR